MPEVKITKKTIIVVNEVGDNQYGDLVWTDKEGKEYKVKSTRKQYFQDIVEGRAVEIGWSEYKGSEYPYSATAIAKELPAKQSADKQFDNLKREQEAKGQSPKPDMSKSDWAEKDRITRKSIERQKSADLAVQIAISNADPSDVRIANEFNFILSLIEGNVKPNRVVEAAKKLGGIIEEEDDMPF